MTIKDNAGTTLSDSAIGNRFMFTGRELDPETGLYHYRARVYSPTLGRFLQTDPVGYAFDLNLYRYVTNNPINWADPYGLWKKKVYDTFKRIKDIVDTIKDNRIPFAPPRSPTRTIPKPVIEEFKRRYLKRPMA